jgi:hypothetical protein
MSIVDTVNDEFEVGFNETFESRWYRAEQAGHVFMLVFALAAGLGFLGRGPFSHDSVQTADGALAADYEPIARHGTNTTITVHVKRPQGLTHPIELQADQHLIEPMGFQRSVPLADSSTVNNDGTRLTFNEAASQSDVLVRFELMPNAVGFVPLHVSDGAESIDWSVLVVP